MRHRRRFPDAGRRLLLATTVAFWLACGGGAELTAPTTGAVEVTTSTTGRELDPDGYTLTLDDVEVQPIGAAATATLAELTPGTHRIGLGGVSANCIVQGDNPRPLTIVAGETAAQAMAVVCAEAPPATGGVRVSASTGGVSPDPDGYSVTVDGDEGRPIAVNGSAAVPDLPAGEHSIGLAGVAGNCTVAGANPRAVTVVASAVVVLDFTVECVALPPATGTLTVTTVTSGPSPDPDGYTFAIGGGASQPIGANASVSVANVAAGTLTLELTGVAANCAVQGQNPRTVSLAASETTRVGFSIQCAATTGSLAITVAGLPAGLSAAVTVSGPAGYTEPLTATRTLTDLAPGQYTVSVASVSGGGVTYASSPRNSTVTVSAGATVQVAVTYASTAGASLNLRIVGLSLTQSVQTFDNAVPLVAGRDALLRVAVLANQRNSVTPAVRVRLYDRGILVESLVIGAPADTTPTGRIDGDLTTTWNQRIPASRVRGGLSVQAEVDPDAEIPETDETDNAFPSAAPLSLSVRAAPPLAITLVPVRQRASQLTGDVTAANRDGYLDLTQRVYPLPGYGADVHAVYTTTTTDALQPDDANGAWNTILSEVAALRLIEGSERHYYGVVRIGYASGLAGRGFLGDPVAIGYDEPSDRGRIAAHELGHTWDRQHAPCGNPGDIDPDFPNRDGTTGRVGYDLADGILKPRTSPDIMGYCGDPWIGDYTYRGVMDFRGTALGRLSVGRAQPSLLVWGRIVNGRAVLEPAFHVVTRPVMPGRPGPYSVEGTASDGSRVFGLSFDAMEVADDERGARHFAFAVPLDERGAARLQTIRLAGPGVGMAAISASPPSLRATPSKPLSAQRSAAGIALDWDAAAHPMIMVRDARSGEVLSFARGGSVVLPAGGSDVELVLSDGVRSRAATESVRR